MPTSDKPGNVSLNLDKLDREGGTPEPFVVVLDGKPYTLNDPQELEWGIVVDVAANPLSFVRAAVPPDKAVAFAAALNKMPAWKVNLLAEKYGEHYGLPAVPEAGASPSF